MTSIIAWFARNHVAANLLMMAMLIGGLVAAPRIPIKTFPDIELDFILVQVPYPGAAPEEIEAGVCVRIEEALVDLGGIDEFSTNASEGVCNAFLGLVPGTDVNTALQEVKSRIDGITTFPTDAEEPIVQQVDFKSPVTDVAIAGRVGERALKAIGERVRDDIANLPGITQAELLYARPFEISIEVPEENLRRFGLTFDEVVGAVRRSSLDLPGGSIKTEGGEVLLRSKGQAYRGDDFSRLTIVTRPDGTRVTLGDVAEVRDGFVDNSVAARFDGEPALMVRAYRVADQDDLAISAAVNRYVREERHRMPPGVTLAVWQDTSEIVRGRLDILLDNGIYGLILVLVSLALFLRFRLAFWVSVGVPIAFMGTIASFPVVGLDLNSISLFAFIVVLGIVVDDAIVVAENVYTHESKSGDRQEAAVRGTQEVAIPVIFGVLTTVAAFAPLMMVPGPMGQFFWVIGATVVACLFYSVVESQLVLPAHLSRGRSANREEAGGEARRAERDGREAGSWRGRFVKHWRAFQGFFSESLERLARERYMPLLRHAMQWRYVSLASGVGALILAMGLIASGRVAFTFFDAVESDEIVVSLSLPEGTPVARTGRAVDHLLETLDELMVELDAEHMPPGESMLRHRLSAIGATAFSGGGPGGGPGAAQGGHRAQIVAEFMPAPARPISTSHIRDLWRDRVGRITEADELSYETELFGPGNAIELQLQGREGVDLASAAEEVMAKLREYPGVIDLARSDRAGKQQIELSILPEAEQLGLSLQDLARQVRQAFYGEEAQRIQRGRDDIRVMVRYPEEQRRSLGDLEEMRIRTPGGAEVPFSTVARAERSRGYARIERGNRMRQIEVTGGVVSQITNGNAVVADLHEDFLPGLKERHPGLEIAMGGAQREQARAFDGLVTGYLLALVAIYALLAIPLRSYLQPLVIMSVIPFGVVGAVVGHLLMGYTFSFMSIIGVVALSGVVVNASLVMVVYINRRLETGMGYVDAVRSAGVARFRPIILTSLTTFIGLTPLMLEQSIHARFLIPMAISLAFGVLFATIITLLLVPCGYLVLDDLARTLRRGRRRRDQRRSRRDDRSLRAA